MGRSAARLYHWRGMSFSSRNTFTCMAISSCRSTKGGTCGDFVHTVNGIPPAVKAQSCPCGPGPNVIDFHPSWPFLVRSWRITSPPSGSGFNGPASKRGAIRRSHLGGRDQVGRPAGRSANWSAWARPSWPRAASSSLASGRRSCRPGWPDRPTHRRFGGTWSGTSSGTRSRRAWRRPG